MNTLRSLALSLVVAGASLTASPSAALACGGCFAPPGAAQVVTDHRMVLSLSSQQTTLWDQFQYTGDPEDFSWILPIRYTDRTRVQLASDDFVTLLGNLLVPALQRPNPPPYPPGCSPRRGEAEYDSVATAGGSAAPPPSAARDAGVTVLRQEVVGPYAVSIVRGTDGMGLRDWLRMNGYSVPAAVEPVVDHYLGLGMDFVALRLRAGKGLNRMVPVRVTLDGNQPRLPLRMIAAGAADRVGLSLTVFAEARIEAMNFPNGELADNDFTYDWNAPPTDLGAVFVRAFAARNDAMGGRLWLTEASMPLYRDSLASQARNFPLRRGSDAGVAMPVSSAEEDVRVAFEGIGARATVTRLRADMPSRMLDRDLDLAASDRGARDRSYRFGREANRPQYSPCPWDPPQSFAGLTCAVASPGAGRDGLCALAAGAAALGLAAFFRKRR